MTRRQFKKLADEFYTNDILTPLERRRKAIEIDMKALTKEKIDEVKALIESGAKKADIIEQTGVSASTVDRVKAGQLTAEGKPEKPKSAPKPKPKPEPVFAELEVAPRPDNTARVGHSSSADRTSRQSFRGHRMRDGGGQLQLRADIRASDGGADDLGGRSMKTLVILFALLCAACIAAEVAAVIAADDEDNEEDENNEER